MMGLNPADEPLTLLEETVLLVLARGEFMAPIGRWGDTLQGLTQRGLAERRDEMNYAITPRGRQVAEAKDDRFVRGWINDSNRAALSRRGLPVTAADVERNGGKIEAGMTGVMRQDVLPFNSGQTGNYDRLTGSPVNDIFIGDDTRRQMVSDPDYAGRPTTVCGLTVRQVRALIAFYEAATGRRADEICGP